MAQYKVCIMYPNKEGARFDFDYYRATHMPLAEKHMKPYGLIKTGVEQGISGGGDQPAPYICVGTLYFDSPDSYDKAVSEVGHILRGDIPNFTDVTPVRQISRILD